MVIDKPWCFKIDPKRFLGFVFYTQGNDQLFLGDKTLLVNILPILVNIFIPV